MTSTGVSFPQRSLRKTLFLKTGCGALGAGDEKGFSSTVIEVIFPSAGRREGVFLKKNSLPPPGEFYPL
jgi:hypothetical protein